MPQKDTFVSQVVLSLKMHFPVEGKRLESAYLDSTIGSIQSVLQRQTEGRVPVFSHEVVPDHLRTKPDPEVEEQEKQLTTDAARIGADVAQVGLSHCPAAPSPSLHKKQDFTKPV